MALLPPQSADSYVLRPIQRKPSFRERLRDVIAITTASIVHSSNEKTPPQVVLSSAGTDNRLCHYIQPVPLPHHLWWKQEATIERRLNQVVGKSHTYSCGTETKFHHFTGAQNGQVEQSNPTPRHTKCYLRRHAAQTHILLLKPKMQAQESTT